MITPMTRNRRHQLKYHKKSERSEITRSNLSFIRVWSSNAVSVCVSCTSLKIYQPWLKRPEFDKTCVFAQRPFKVVEVGRQ